MGHPSEHLYCILLLYTSRAVHPTADALTYHREDLSKILAGGLSEAGLLSLLQNPSVLLCAASTLCSGSSWEPGGDVVISETL